MNAGLDVLSLSVGRREVVVLPAFDRTRLIGASEDLGARQGVRLALYPLAPAMSFAALIDSLLDLLSETLSGLWPAWFPVAGDFERASTIARTVLHDAAEAQARRIDVSAIWLRRAATLSMAGQPPRTPDLPRAMECHDLCAAIAAGSGARRLVIALDPQGGEADFGRWMEGMCRWLVNCADVTVWIPAPAARWQALGVFRAAGGPALEALDREPEIGPPPRVTSFFGGIVGLPNPNSPAELALYKALAAADWAGGCGFNRVIAIPAAPKVDVLWEQERLVVEIDGDDHRAKAKYADDRLREFALLQAGYIILRLTNEQVLSDLQLSLAKVKAVLTRQRNA